MLTAEPEQMLATAMIGWLTTVYRGQPQSSPVGFLWADDAVWLGSEPGKPKVRNIANEPLVAFHLDQSGRRVVTMECRAEVIDDLPGAAAAEYRRKYEAMSEMAGRSLEELEAQFSVCLRLAPTRVRSW